MNTMKRQYDIPDIKAVEHEEVSKEEKMRASRFWKSEEVKKITTSFLEE